MTGITGRGFAAFVLITSLGMAAPVSSPSQADPPLSAETLQAVLAKARTAHDVPALAAGVLREGLPTLTAVVGVRKREVDTPAGVSDQWHLGSNTKPFTALLIAMLVEEGLLDWNTPLATIFPEQAEKWNADLRAITPAHLLTHTSGLPPTGPLLGFLIVRKQGSPVEDRTRLIGLLESVTPSRKPGEKYEYSNLGYVVLGAILDQRGKAPWEEQLEKKILQPLGIKKWGLGPVGDKQPPAQPWPHHASGKPVSPTGVLDNPPILNSAGRLRLSVEDYLRFLAETLKLARGEKGLLKPATAQKLYTNPYAVSPHSLSGWMSIRKEPADKDWFLGHDGSNSFNYCSAIVMPQRNLAFCVLTNQGGPGGPGAKACGEVRQALQTP